MATDAKDQLELDVLEEKDGSAVVDLPKEMLADEDDGDENQKNESKAQESEEDGEIQDHPDDDAALRAAKREKRKLKQIGRAHV